MKRLDVSGYRSIFLAPMDFDCAGLAQLDRDDPWRRIDTEKHCVLFKFHFLTADYADKRRFESGNQEAMKNLAQFLDSWVPGFQI